MAGAWVIGHNIAGYLPESDTFAYATRREAVDALAEEMRRYADEDDENTLDSVTDGDGRVFTDEEAPAMRATVDSVLADDGPETTSGDWSSWIEDGSGCRIAFWLTWELTRFPDGYTIQWCAGDRDVTAHHGAERDATEYRLWTEDATLVVAFKRETPEHPWRISGSDVADWTALFETVGDVGDPEDFDLRLLG
jgi:hypothetical protein